MYKRVLSIEWVNSLMEFTSDYISSCKYLSLLDGKKLSATDVNSVRGCSSHHLQWSSSNTSIEAYGEAKLPRAHQKILYAQNLQSFSLVMILLSPHFASESCQSHIVSLIWVGIQGILS